MNHPQYGTERTDFTPKRKLSIPVQLIYADAIRRLDGDLLRQLNTTHELGLPVGQNQQLEFWGTIHTVRIHLSNATDAERAQSEAWLRQAGMDVPRKK